jgi:STE24 endopeptidase
MRLIRLLICVLVCAFIAGAAGAAGFDVEAATRAYLEKIPAASRSNSDAYFTGGYWLQLVDLVYGIVVAGLLLATGLSAKIRDRLSLIFKRAFVRTAAFAAVYVLLTFVLLFPLAAYEGFVREHTYGFATQNFAQWLGDAFKGLAVNVVLMSLGLAVLYSVIRKLKASWWLWGTMVSIVLLTFVIFIQPVVIEPMFNEYKPMPAGAVKTEILRIAHANNIPTNDVLMVDASRQTKRVSANVAGIGSTVRIALNDNLLNRASPEGVAAVMGHEMGHYVLNHVVKMLVFLAVILAFGFLFIDRSYSWVARRWGQRFGTRDIGDEAGLPIVMALLSVYFFMATPLMNTIVRTQEAEADYFGLNASQQPDGFAEAMLMTAEYRKAEPGKWEEILFYDHPSPHTRLHNAMQWKAENLGRSRPIVDAMTVVQVEK